MEKKSLISMRISRLDHMVTYINASGTITLTAQYKGQTPLRARLVNKTKKLETGILLDHIQLVIFENNLKLQEYHELGK